MVRNMLRSCSSPTWAQIILTHNYMQNFKNFLDDATLAKLGVSGHESNRESESEISIEAWKEWARVREQVLEYEEIVESGNYSHVDFNELCVAKVNFILAGGNEKSWGAAPDTLEQVGGCFTSVEEAADYMRPLYYDVESQYEEDELDARLGIGRAKDSTILGRKVGDYARCVYIEVTEPEDPIFALLSPQQRLQVFHDSIECLGGRSYNVYAIAK